MEDAAVSEGNAPSPRGRSVIPTRPKDGPLTSSERAHLLRSRKPLDKRSSSSKARRTCSFSAYEPAARDALAEILRTPEPEKSPLTLQEQKDDIVLRVKAPDEEVVLRHVRRRDAPSVQRLLTPRVLVTLGDDEIDQPVDFCSAVKYVEGIMDVMDWIDVTRNDDSGDSDEDTDTDSDSDGDDPPNRFPKSFAIALDDRLIGVISAWIRSEGADRSAEIVYWLGEEYWGRGIASAVVRPYVDWIWRTFSWIDRVDAGVYSTWNPASRRVLEKTGFKYEGTMRKAVWREGKEGSSDVELWGMLRDEWNEIVGDR